MPATNEGLAVRCPWAPLQRLQQHYASLAVPAYDTLPFLSCDGAHVHIRKVARKRPVSRLAEECENATLQT